MAVIRGIPRFITGGEVGNGCPLIVFSKDLLSATAIAVYYVTATNVDGSQVKLALWDTAGQQNYVGLQLSSNRDGILTCFSMDSPDSTEKNAEFGKPKVRHFCPSMPNFLAVNKTLRNHRLSLEYPAMTKPEHVALEERRPMAEKINA
ncbi:ras-like GTP-binding protein RHO [Rhipicephalus sanguineus]|uniref:Uncharacterized protein n=1 Tax=Rhipicephalus sanguineus TaxID=34632 RepID=A0A9D4T9M0_RHISA|nr:ras-like GTP-binding protein RHO [Rhipicephalus sanguineus]KAH7983402.1 hypothetical protein HPB52_011658 [Rhipicephalus sanguineus]